MNNIFLDISVSLLIFSLSVNAVLIYYSFKVQKKPKPEMTYDARALLQDLSTGPALVKIEYVDRSEVLLRSPRHL